MSRKSGSATSELIAEELLTNIIRAADIEGRPTHVTMDCALTPAAIALTVRDDGREFDPLAVEEPGSRCRHRRSRRSADSAFTSSGNSPTTAAMREPIAGTFSKSASPVLLIATEVPGMSLTIVQRSNPPTLALAGRLDTNTAPQLDQELDRVLHAGEIKQLVFDLSQLEYLSSAGIRCFIRARKVIEPRGGKVAIVNPQPGVRKVLDIVKAIPSAGIFGSVAELDEYLDAMQKQVREGE